MQAKAGQHRALAGSDLHLRDARTAAATLIAVAAWAYAVGGWSVAATPRTHIAIPSALFDVAAIVCKNNGGYRSVTVERKSDIFTFTCNDGLSLRDTIVRVK